MFHSTITAADLLARLRAETPSPKLGELLLALLKSDPCDGDGPVVTPPLKLTSQDDLLAHALAALLNDVPVDCTEVGEMIDDASDWDTLYMAGIYVLASRGEVHLPGGTRVLVSPILELSDLYERATERDHLLVRVDTGTSTLTYAHSDAVTLPRALLAYVDYPDHMLSEEAFMDEEAAFYATLAARGVMAGVLQFLRGVELSAGPLLALIRRGEWRVAM